MKTLAAVLHEMGKPRPYEQSRPLAVEELDLAPPQAGEALVKLGAAGLCHSDLSVIEGNRPRPMPMVIGHEAAGIVQEIGPGVRGLKPGDHVVFSFIPLCGECRMCLTGRSWLCENGIKTNVAGTLLGGGRRFSRAGRPVSHHVGVSGFSQFTVAAAHSLVKIDSNLPMTTAALFGCAVVTGVGAIVNTAKVPAGSSTAIFGLGGVGLAAVMGAALAGAYPIVAVDIRADKLELAKKAGATHLLNATGIDSAAAIRDMTGGGVEYAFDAAGRADVFEAAYNATQRGGTTVSVSLPHPREIFHAQHVQIVNDERTIKGSYMGSCVPSRDMPRYIELYQSGKLPVDLLVSKTIELKDINRGFDVLAGGDAVRQIVTF